MFICPNKHGVLQQIHLSSTCEYIIFFNEKKKKYNFAFISSFLSFPQSWRTEIILTYIYMLTSHT